MNVYSIIKYIKHQQKLQGKSPLPSIRVVIRSGHSEEDLTGMALSLNEKAISILASSS